MSGDFHVDVMVYGGTAPAIAAAVRAAREGLSVALITPTRRLGGSFPSLGAVETHYRGSRSPLVQEFVSRVLAHYRDTHGLESPQYKSCASGMMVVFEPKVAERILHDWVDAERRIVWLPGFAPVSAERAQTRINAVFFSHTDGSEGMRVSAGAFVEGSDEGDLMAAVGVAFRIGREGRGEFGEPRAGRVFTRWLNGVHPRDAAEGRLNLVTARATTSDPLPGSTGEGDDNIQSFSYRICLTDDPANRRMLDAPPPGYDRERYAPILLPPAEKERLSLPFHHRFLIYSLREMAERDHLFHGHALPNRKRSWNATNLTGAGKHYAGSDAEGRRQIERAHRDHALGLMYFLQNDPAMPGDLRESARDWGLARDEFVDTDNFPPELYVRESRRLVGRAVFTELDALAADEGGRAPVKRDSIGITEFSLDSLACTCERLLGENALCDGQLFQMEVSRPGQVPFGALLPKDIENLVVTTTVSATHVGWGTVRQTPTLMHLAESAALALALAARAGVAPANLDVERLQRLLVERGVMISFFNELDMASPDAWVSAAQFLGTRGYFETYDARPAMPIDEATARHWSALSGVPLPMLLRAGAPFTRGQACKLIYDSLSHSPAS